jgi:hypothetical protein
VYLLTKAELLRLVDEVSELAESKENKELQAWWDARQPGRFLYQIDPTIGMWSDILDFSLLEHYSDPIAYAGNVLRIALYRFKEFGDVPLAKSITLGFDAPFESTLFGMEWILSEHIEPWLGREPAIANKEDLDKIGMPDFYKSGLMPLAHRYYEELRGVLPEDFEVVFPNWRRSQFGVAWHIRGHNDLLMDMIDDQEFFHKLMSYLTDVAMDYCQKRADFLGKEVEPTWLGNDEVNCPTVSPGMYENLILPYEIKLAEFLGGLTNWHSCGDTTPLVHLIDRIPGLQTGYCGPWNDMRKTVEVLGKNNRPVYIGLNIVDDVLEADGKAQDKKIQQIKETCADVVYWVRMGPMGTLNGPEGDLPKIKEWVARAQRANPDYPVRRQHQLGG